MNELTRWKKELESTLQDYVQNPCIKTADAMLRTALAFKSGPDNAVHQGGTVLAIVEEAKRIGQGGSSPARLTWPIG